MGAVMFCEMVSSEMCRVSDRRDREACVLRCVMMFCGNGVGRKSLVYTGQDRTRQDRTRMRAFAYYI